MKILQLTPGTGNFHCGSCLRDEALTVATRRLGHDVHMVPLYLPLVTEGFIPDRDRVFVGGINIYLQQKLPFLRHTPAFIDRLFDARPLLNIAAGRAGMTDPHELGQLTVSMLEGEHGIQRKELGHLIDFVRREGLPDIVVLSNALLTGMAGVLKRELDRPIICTLQGEDTFIDDLPQPHRTRAWEQLATQCAHVDAFVPVSDYYRAAMADRLRIAPDRVVVIRNGIILDGHDRADSPPSPPTIGFLARLCPPKGLHHLVDAFIELHRRGRVPDCRLHIAGAKTAADDTYLDQQKQKLADAGLVDHVHIRTNITRDEKLAFLKGLSLLSVPAMYGESFGLYVIEAMASGVPVVQPRHAAFEELLADTGGGILTDDASPATLAAAYESLLLDPPRSAALADAGRQAVHQRYGVDRAARELTDLYTQVIGRRATEHNG